MTEINNAGALPFIQFRLVRKEGQESDFLVYGHHRSQTKTNFLKISMKIHNHFIHVSAEELHDIK